ncbi:MAG: LmeA family phospholipid-binding protein [Chthonomonadales bacterium]
MEDAVKDLGYALIGLALFSGLMTGRAQYAARRDLHHALPGAKLSVRVDSRGVFGMALGRAYRVRIEASDFGAASLPFTLEPGGGPTAEARHLQLHLRDIVLAGLPVKLLDADIPFVKVDAGRALFSGHLTLRSAEAGTGTAILTEDGLARFLASRHPELTNVRVVIGISGISVSARTGLLLGMADIEMQAGLAVREGRYLDAVSAKVSVGGREVPASLAARLLAVMNPVLDVERDLHLGDWLYVTGLELQQGAALVRARVTIPAKRKEKME